MSKSMVTCGIAAIVFVACAHTPAWSQIWFVDTTSSAFSDKHDLHRIGVFRDGPGYVYDFDELILGNVTAINIPGSAPTVILSPDGYPAGGAPDALLNDATLNSGMVTPGLGDGDFQPGDEFTEYTFTQPVRNGPGVDLLLSFITFEFATFESDPGPYWLQPDGGTPTQIDRAANVDLSSVESIPFFAYLNGGPTDPTDLLSTNVQATGFLGNASATPRPSLQLIDLTELGIAPGGTVSSLRIWDDDFSNGNTIYPTMIAGFPIPEPSTGAMAIVGVVLLANRNRRRRKRC